MKLISVLLSSLSLGSDSVSRRLWRRLCLYPFRCLILIFTHSSFHDQPHFFFLSPPKLYMRIVFFKQNFFVFFAGKFFLFCLNFFCVGNFFKGRIFYSKNLFSPKKISLQNISQQQEKVFAKKVLYKIFFSCLTSSRTW